MRRSPRQSRPIPVTLGSVEATIDPGLTGLAADPGATVERVGGQPLNPITRVMSFFVQTPVALVSSVDEQALTASLDEIGAAVAEDPVEGSIVFVDGEPVASDPQSGQRLDVTAAAATVLDNWATGETLDLPIVELPRAPPPRTWRRHWTTSPRLRCRDLSPSAARTESTVC